MQERHDPEYGTKFVWQLAMTDFGVCFERYSMISTAIVLWMVAEAMLGSSTKVSDSSLEVSGHC